MKAVARLVSRVLPDSAFGRSTVKIVGGTALAQVIAFAASPLLTRIYDPGAYGVFATLVGIASTLTVISSLSYEVSIPVPRGQRMAVNAIFLCLALLGASVVLTTLVLLAFAPTIAGWLFDGQTSPAWLLAIPLLLAGMGFNQIASAAALRARAFNAISGVRIVQAGTTAACQAALFPADGMGLAGGMIAGQLIGARRLWRAAFPDGASEGVNLRNIGRAMSRFRRFPLFEGPFSLVNSAGNYLPPVLLVAFFGPAIGGLFALAQRVLSAPVGMVATASGQVFFASAAQANRDGSLGGLVAQVQNNLSRLVLPAMVLLALTGPDVFAFVFGERWRDAGTVAALMTPWLYMQALGSTVSTVWVVQGNLHHGTVIGLAGFVLRCAALLSAVWIKDWVLVIGIFSAVNAFYYLVVALYAVRFSRASLPGFALDQGKALAVALAFALPTAAGLIAGGMLAVLAGLAMSGLLLLPYYHRVVRGL
ncbi:lipopolysaccharide biosynthesis protein [Novosphingobium sp. TH158]|uniref:lipopolysaccharide biosynthesis protein n=1 Tax=Novosphingobium sp. TH158 TaxID=2067455 RepID=UPI000C7A40C2|nr:oligosaccharide flippase family protein [Novosphingobium sp. TH158]PLK27162.1 hypothetical protein C0V78_09890 [Novosphingobium sp. TH158]